ncbi:MAG: DUF4258 domain-containing protein [Desulfobacterales bacterium]
MSDNNNILTTEEAERKIREILKYRYFTASPYCRIRMKERGYDDIDIELVLSKGKVKEPPEYNTKYNNWVCKVEGKVVEGDKTVVVTAIVSNNQLLCITLYSK